MFRLLGIWALSLACLSGCMQTGKQGVTLPETEWSDARIASMLYGPHPETALSEQVEAEPPLPQRRPAEQPAQLAELPTEAGDGKAPDIEKLVGLDFDATQALLGEPALDEVQPPARVWAYNGTGCVLNIFFYPNVDGQSYRALTYEVKGAEDTPERVRQCFAELVQEKKGT